MNIIGISLMKVGVMSRLCSCPGASLMVLLLILVGVASGDPSSTVKALKFTQIIQSFTLFIRSDMVSVLHLDIAATDSAVTLLECWSTVTCSPMP